MPTCNVNITTVTDNGDGTGTGTYGDGGGVGTVQSDGTIDVSSQGTAVDLQFSITASGYTFDNPGFTATPLTFGVPSNTNSTTCKVNDTESNQYEYTLHLLNSSGGKVALDPRVINR